MIPLIKNIKRPLKGSKGFTFIELMMVLAIGAVLSSIAILNYIPVRAKALDSAARSDARNIVSSVVDAIVNNEDVDYTKFNTGGPVGDTDTAGVPRPPIYVLSTGVMASIVGDSVQAPGGNTTIFQAIIYHIGGTPDGATLSGRTEFTCSVDEDTGVTIVPN